MASGMLMIRNVNNDVPMNPLIPVGSLTSHIRHLHGRLIFSFFSHYNQQSQNFSSNYISGKRDDMTSY